MASRRERGYGLIDGLVAALIMALAVTSSFVAWAVMFRHDGASRLIGQAAQIARGEVERARLFGADNLPFGVYSAASATATWTGAFDPTSGTWVSGGAACFDAFGNRVASSDSAAALSMQTAVTDSNVLASSAGYSLQPASERKLVVTVTGLSDGNVLYVVSTYLVEGGL